jgi:hypothetical protein
MGIVEFIIGPAEGPDPAAPPILHAGSKGNYGGAHRNSRRPQQGLSPAHAPLALRLALGASSFSLSSASGIIRPNIELSIAVGIRPALLFS